MHFGELLKQKYIEKLTPKRPMPKWIGCSEEDIINIMKVQGVRCLPETYVEIMSAIGRSGIDFFLFRDTTYDVLCGDVYQVFQGDLESIGLTMPDDLFVFATHEYHQFFFFRTSPCESNPVVYGFDGVTLIKADTDLQSFYLDLISILENDTRSNKQPSLNEVIYDSELDKFKPKNK